MEFTSGLLIGAVIGAIFSVTADRLWRRMESRPRIRAVLASYSDVRKRSGVQYTIENIGVSSLPDYNIWIYHPQRGSFNPFEDEHNGDLHSGQERTHLMIQIDRGNAVRYEWFYRCKGETVSEVIFDEFEIQLRMKNSNVTLFRSVSMGNAFAKQCVKTIETNISGNWSWDEQLELDTPRPTTWQRRRNRLLVMLGLRHQSNNKNAWEED